jgi:hypothetical protein
MLALRLVSASVTAMLPQLTGEGASALADMGLTPARLGDTAPPAATEVTLERMTSDTSTAAESKKENELYSWLRDKAGLSQAVIEKSKAKLSEEDVDSVEALQALHKLGQLADVFSPVPAQQIADALATDAAEEVKKNPWETGEPGYWDTNGQWVSTDAPAQGGENPAASLQPEEGRCGPMFNGTRCDCSQANWAVFCNSANGWCGDSAEHANADDLTKFDCPLQLRPALPTEGRCGPLFKGKRCDCSGVFKWCNSGTGWCGDTAEHAKADKLTKFDCPNIPQPTPEPTEGRCGALFDGARCDCSGAFLFCNSENGWCGDTAEHANADELTKFDCPHRKRPSLSTEGRCGPLFKGKRCDCSTDSSFQWCNSGTGWCGDSTEHANADDLTKYDCLSARDAPGAPEAQGHGKEENRTGDPSLDELEERLRDLEEMRCQTAGKRCKAAAVPVPVPPDSSKRSEGGKTPSIAGGSLVS